MCGINAFIGSDKEKLEKMNAALSHRGPDFAGVYVDSDVSMGHVLLSIREVSEISKQPYTLDDEWVLLFNGQIYNTEQLKKNLSNLESDKEKLDTYILYKTIQRYGWNFITYIQGMYAIVVYNKKEKKLRAYRDESGQKNLYYYHKDGKLIFSSEIKGILVHDIDRTEDIEAVAIACHLGYIPKEKTLFSYIKKIEPGQYIDYRNKNLTAAFFTSDTKNYYPNDPAKAFELLVTEHIQSKDRVSINLSGGLDSSLLLHEIAKTGYTIDSYTTSFTDSESIFNEDAELAKKLSSDYGTNHRDIVISKKEYLNNLIEAYETIEEPNYNISNPIYLITAKTEGIAGDKKRVVLSGDGGDEIFGGYSYYAEQKRLERQMSLFPKSLYNYIKNKRNNTDTDYFNLDQRWLLSKKIGKNFGPEFDMKHFLSNPNEKTILHMMKNDRKYWLPGENFIRSDKLYMSQSMELRSPFSYTPFRDYIDSLLTEKDYFKGDKNKIWLRNYAEGRLPDYITHRKNKTGWRAPVEYWYDKEFKKVFLDIISERIGKGSIVNWQKVLEKIETTDKWPKKMIHLYLSLAILSNKFNLNI
jgi:asparagine synthase (glutamine-hydrolysing)